MKNILLVNSGTFEEMPKMQSVSKKTYKPHTTLCFRKIVPIMQHRFRRLTLLQQYEALFPLAAPKWFKCVPFLPESNKYAARTTVVTWRCFWVEFHLLGHDRTYWVWMQLTREPDIPRVCISCLAEWTCSLLCKTIHKVSLKPFTTLDLWMF